MRKILPFVIACCVGISVADAAVRDASTVSRARATPTVSRTTSGNVISRTTTKQNTSPRSQSVTVSGRPTTSRAATTTASRAATARNATSAPSRARTATTTTSRATSSAISRAATTIDTSNSKTFGTGYNSCRDAYFTCMDQFCASADDTYRRCVCSSRLYEIRKKQRALGQSADQLQDFKDLNLEAIPKTAAEVKAMQNASEGELVATVIKDKSASIAQLAGISAVLSNTKSKSLSTAGQLDIAGDINAIWATTDLTSGLNISNLNGEALYSAVHSQCVNLVADRCSSRSLLNMVVSAYNMYIENDCSLLSNALDKQKTTANASIRETEREMNIARLENYDAHNSSSINECIALVRHDVTSDAACGENYVHCLDTTGLYLNKTTGEPIYTSNFYQLGNTLSLSGDILTNQTNRILVSELNRKRMFAEKSLDTCRDLADEVWDEFMRQAVTEIYQGQQTRIRDVKNECLDVVNQCYDQQSNSLKDFSNVKEQLLLGARLELSEELCREKLAACSNLYGGGPSGMAELLTTMYDITTQKIAQNCFTTLQEYAKQLCAVPGNDSLHSYPYACRAYAPGEQRYAERWKCNSDTTIPTIPSVNPYTSTTTTTSTPQTKADTDETTITSETGVGGYVCTKKYTSCNPGYYMLNPDNKIVFEPYTEAVAGNRCVKCPGGMCPKQTTDDEGEQHIVVEGECGLDYAGSLYQKLVRYAVQACMRPTESEKLNVSSILPDTLLQDVNATMDLIKASMATSLKTECERLGGHWVSAQWDESVAENTGIKLFLQFYNETGANTKWGYCADPDTITAYYTGEDPNAEEDDEAENGSDDSGNGGITVVVEELYNAYSDNQCDGADANYTIEGCVKNGFRCDRYYMVYNGKCILQCYDGVIDLNDCNEISANGTRGGCATFYCRCPANKYSLHYDHNGGGTCTDTW